MSADGTNNGSGNGRRGSVTSAAFSTLFQRTNSMSAGSAQPKESPTAANARDQRRRLSVTTLGLGTTPPAATTSPFGLRRGSISTATSESIDENAVDDEDSAKPPNNGSFNRRMSFGTQNMRTMRGAPPTSPGQNDNAFNWSEQLRSRAESSVAGGRPAFGSMSGSPPRAPPAHDRAKSISDMPAPPQQAPAARPPQPERPKPDHMQERILKGDFYMD